MSKVGVNQPEGVNSRIGLKQLLLARYIEAKNAGEQISNLQRIVITG